jgi:hypothetical protein
MRTIVPWWASGAFGTLEDVHQPRSTARSIAIAATLTASAVLVGCTAVDATTTLITVDADPAGHPDMPAHVHPGSCAQLIPQPRFALENIVDGHSSTRVPASFEELTVPGQAINLHESNTALDVYTACVDL